MTTTTPPVQLPQHGSEGQVWSALLDVADAQPAGWTLVGALMVMLHAYETGIATARATRDIDAMVRVRGVAHATRKFTETLEHLGWELHPGHPTSDGIAFRYVKGEILFDALAPDGLGQRADLTTFGSARTVEIPGGSRALAHSRNVRVMLGGWTSEVPCPDLIGALTIKSRAAATDQGSTSDPHHRAARYVEDLAILYACADNLSVLADTMSRSERRALRDAPAPHWDALDPQYIAQAQAAHRYLTRGEA